MAEPWLTTHAPAPAPGPAPTPAPAPAPAAVIAAPTGPPPPPGDQAPPNRDLYGCPGAVEAAADWLTGPGPSAPGEAYTSGK